MRKKVKHIKHASYEIIIIFDDDSKIIAYTDSRMPKLITRHVIVDNYNIPDSGFSKTLSIEYNYSNTYAIISTNIVHLTFYRASDYQQFAKSK